MDRVGQSALFDAFLFLTVAIVASAAVLSYASLASSRSEALSRERALEYAEDVRVALMRTTLGDAGYLNRTGARVDLGGWVTVERFLLDEADLRTAGLPEANFAGTNAAIGAIAAGLVRPPFSVGVQVDFEGDGGPADLWIGTGAGPPPDRYTAGWTYETTAGLPVTIAVHLWTV